MANVKGNNTELLNKINQGEGTNNTKYASNTSNNMNLSMVMYTADNGAIIQLTPNTVKRYLVSGDASKVTDQEILMFMKLCEYQRLNPFIREAYLIKYGNEPATMVTGKDTFVKRAAKSKLCAGFEAGIIIQKSNGEIENRKGSLKLANEKLVGGWAKVYRKDWTVPLENTVSIEEYVRKKKDGQIMSNWAKMPATMIRKVALVQTLREALPEEFQGMYSPEEMPIDDSALPENEVNIDECHYEVHEENEEEKEEDNIIVELENMSSINNEDVKASKEQLQQIWILAQELGMGKEELKEFIKQKTGKENGKDLDIIEADMIIDELKIKGE